MRPLGRRLIASILLVGFLAGFSPGEALAGPKPMVKLTRGAVNTTTGWLEISRQLSERKVEAAPFWWFHGTLYGLTMATTRTLYGAYDLITFAFPPYDAPVMDPETLIQPRPSTPPHEKAAPPEKS